MAAIEAEVPLGAATSGHVRRKSNNTRKLINKASRVTRGSPEVMVKITSFGKGAKYIAAHMKYISRDGETELETDRGLVLNGKEAVEGYFKGWQSDIAAEAPVGRRSDQRDTMNLILSMPPGTPVESVRFATRDFARDKFSNHEYVFAIHDDADGGNPHAHLTVKMLSFDNSRLDPKKADLQDWREGFAQAMRDQGEDAEATPRTARGVVKKPVRQVICHIERGDPTHPPRTPRVVRGAVNEAAAELQAEARGVSRPSSPAQQARERAMAAHVVRREAWLAAAAALEQPQPHVWRKTNARPDYDNIDAGRQRALHAAAAVYQSNPWRHGSQLAPAALASMRNMPGLARVHDAPRVEMLLGPNAPGRLGTLDTAPHLGVRRPRVGDYGHSGGREQVGVAEVPRNPEFALAGRIRDFVSSMRPAKVEATRFEQIKVGLRLYLSERVKQVPAADSAQALDPLVPTSQLETRPASPARPEMKRDVER